MSSPYMEILKIKEKMREIIPQNNQTLGLERLDYSRNLGSSASGMVLAKSEHNGIPVFVKLFPTVCKYKQIRRSSGELFKIRREPKFDKDLLEIGITQLMSNLLFDDIPFTQNLVSVYATSSCNFAYETDISKCSCSSIPNDNSFIVSKERSGYPHESLMNRYNNGELSDRVNWMVIENCSSDLENFLKRMFIDYSNGLVNDDHFDKLMNSIFLQIILTLKCLDNIFKPFLHSDLGCRNILITQCNYKIYGNDTYFKYTITSNNKFNHGQREYNIENMNVIPKIYDFSNVKLTEEQGILLKETGLFSYLEEDDEMKTCTTEIIPNMSQLCESIIKIPEFQIVNHTPFAEKMKLIVEIWNDQWDDFIQLFDLYIPTNNKQLLYPIFQYVET